MGVVFPCIETKAACAARELPRAASFIGLPVMSLRTRVNAVRNVLIALRLKWTAFRVRG